MASTEMVFFFLLYHKPLTPVGFYGGTDGLISCLLFGVGSKFFIVTPRMFTFSLEYVEE